MTNSIQACLAQAVALLSHDSARLDSEVLLAHVLGKSRSYLYTWPESLVSDAEYQQFLHCIARIQQGEPVAYVVGYQEFWSLPLAVNSATLIPRPETEQLVDAVLTDYADVLDAVVWDAGTGSGAIALALKKEKPRWRIVASDVSFAALQMAQKNSQQLRLAIDCIQANWLSAIADNSLDLIVSNPPYIAPNDQHLTKLAFEPITALVAENEGMADIQILCREAFQKLKSSARLYIEHGYDQELAVTAAFIAQGFIHVLCHKDYAGLPRFTSGVKP